MNEQATVSSPLRTMPARADVDSAPGEHLLNAIISLRGSVGDDLNDREFTHLLESTELPFEAGFSFLCFCGGVVTLNVPPQDLRDWYPEKGWIFPGKEATARTIAKKYALSVHEPPDIASGFLCPATAPLNTHHHLEMGTQKESVIVIHPRYLKIRLFAATSAILYSHTARNPSLLHPELLHDLAQLYRPL